MHPNVAAVAVVVVVLMLLTLIRTPGFRFQADIGRHDGGFQCFYAAGFKLVHREGDTLDPETFKPQVKHGRTEPCQFDDPRQRTYHRAVPCVLLTHGP